MGSDKAPVVQLRGLWLKLETQPYGVDKASLVADKPKGKRGWDCILDVPINSDGENSSGFLLVTFSHMTAFIVFLVHSSTKP